MSFFFFLSGIFSGILALCFFATHARVRWEMERGLSAHGRHQLYWIVYNGCKAAGLARVLLGTAGAAVILGLCIILTRLYGPQRAGSMQEPADKAPAQEGAVASCEALRLEMARLSRDAQRTFEGDRRMRDLSSMWERRCSRRGR